VPRTTDHDERRAHLVKALLRIAGRQGLRAVTMRSVAAEAGVSLRIVQYYFGTKEELLHAALRHLGASLAERVGSPLVAAGPDGSDRDTIERWLLAMLPMDQAGRESWIVFAEYHALALTDPALAAIRYTDMSTSFENALADLVGAAQKEGRIAPGRDPRAEAAILLATTTGLGDSIMAGMRDAEQAATILRYHLDRLFENPSRTGSR
jgi:AcrR family transcriptional regulator